MLIILHENIFTNCSKKYILTQELLSPRFYITYPEWPHRQCVGLAYPWKRVLAPVAAASFAICSPHLHREIRGAHGVLALRVGVRQVNWTKPSLTPLSVAGCGRLQLGVLHWATSIDYCK